ncbi:MAG: Uma2 family endonuclease [Nocardioidaceae bacterium]|nr:Uma2 family endonuclease [Nocardioidaceae bacterium]
MSDVMTLPRRPLRVGDLEGVPDDGHRYELVDGTLVVAPSPELSHQAIQSNLLRLLLDRCPPELFVLASPTDVVLADDTVVQPDALVVRRSDLAARRLTAVPLLVVEILSPSTRLVDLGLKLARYESAGVADYWVIDPEGEMTLSAWRLVDGRYGTAVRVSGDREWVTSAPYDLRISPGRLRP